jgi:hypothetical protein
MPAADLWLIGAMLAQGVLVFAITALLYRQRIPRVLRREVRIKDIAIDKSGWPEEAQLVANAYGNQFEMPVLFFAAGVLALHFGATWIEVILAWLFAISRCVHAFIHLTDNHVPRRFAAFATGVIIVALFWVDLIVRLILVAGGAR